MWCSAGFGLSTAGAVARRRPHGTLTPSRTSAAALATRSGVRRLSAPRSSSSPQRPHRFVASNSSALTKVSVRLGRGGSLASRSTRPDLLHELHAFGGHARARANLYLGRVVHSTTRRAHDLVADLRTAHAVAVEDRRTVGSGPPVAPRGESDEGGCEIATLVGQQVLVQLGLLGVRVPSHDPGGDES